MRLIFVIALIGSVRWRDWWVLATWDCGGVYDGGRDTRRGSMGGASTNRGNHKGCPYV